MKKLICLMLFLTLILAACNSTESSISEIQGVPNKVQVGVNSDYTLQLINEGENTAYILFQSKGIVTAELEVKDNILNIKLDKAKQENNELNQYVFKLTRGEEEYDTINVLVNGQPMPFDNATGVN
ncbi:peptidylprolyl isomerase [Psychrobacillus sp. FSL K6-2836]|uniref:peptidylprolyl isomerase n=1 Tax=Psychrobacillus sp. FSL K6-2836 TaxID=2921548 RepID=UPI0030FB3CBB